MAKIKFYRGDTVNINLTFTGVDLTGATVYFTAKSEVDNVSDDSSAVVKKSTTTHTDPTNGKTTIKLDPSDTTTITPDNYLYDIQLKTSAGDITTTEVGKLEVLGDITRRTS